MGPSLTHVQAGREGREGDSAWAVSQQERWIYPARLSPLQPRPGHVGTCDATDWVLAARGLGILPSQLWKEMRQQS